MEILSPSEEVKILLEMVAQAKQQVQSGEQPCLVGFLDQKGVPKSQQKAFVEKWCSELTGIIKNAGGPTTIRMEARVEEFHHSALRLLLAAFAPGYRSRMQRQSPTPGAPADEERASLLLTEDELRNMLLATLAEAPFVEPHL